MMWICPICFEVFSLKHPRCPACGSTLVVVSEQTFMEKLGAALDDPEPRTASRAAELLVERRAFGDVMPVLLRAMRRHWHRPEIAVMIVRAIGRFGDQTAHDALIEALGHDAVVVRAAAAECLQQRSRAGSGQLVREEHRS